MASKESVVLSDHYLTWGDETASNADIRVSPSSALSSTGIPRILARPANAAGNVFPMMAGSSPEADVSITSMAAFIRKHLGLA